MEHVCTHICIPICACGYACVTQAPVTYVHAHMHTSGAALFGRGRPPGRGNTQQTCIVPGHVAQCGTQRHTRVGICAVDTNAENCNVTYTALLCVRSVDGGGHVLPRLVHTQLGPMPACKKEAVAWLYNTYTRKRDDVDPGQRPTGHGCLESKMYTTHCNDVGPGRRPAGHGCL